MLTLILLRNLFINIVLKFKCFIENIFDLNNKIKISSENPDFNILEKKYKNDVGYDILYEGDGPIYIEPFQSILLNTFIKIDSSKLNNYYIQIANRSSMSLKNIMILGGVIDQGYKGYIKLIIYNLNKDKFVIKKNDKIAQLIFLKYKNIDFEVINNINFENSIKDDKTERNDNGFGSTNL